MIVLTITTSDNSLDIKIDSKQIIADVLQALKRKNIIKEYGQYIYSKRLNKFINIYETFESNKICNADNILIMENDYEDKN